MRRLSAAVLVLSLLSVACTSGPAVSAIGETSLACTDRFCVTHPTSWEIVDQGAEHVSFANVDDPDGLIATAGVVNMQGLVEANGGTWPQSPRGVVEVMWSALDNGEADLGEIRSLEDGSVRSFGVFQGGRLWHRLVPVDATRAVGVDVRAPSRAWETHADVFLEGLQVLPAGG
jgi:hypothetical protein